MNEIFETARGKKSNKQNRKESNKQGEISATHIADEETLSLIFKDLLQINETRVQ